MKEEQISIAVSETDSPFQQFSRARLEKNQTSDIWKKLTKDVVFSAKIHSFEYQAILGAIERSLNTAWWESLADETRLDYLRTIKNFLSWFTDYAFTDENRYKVLKEYEKHRACYVQKRSTGVRSLLVLIKRSFEDGGFPPKHLNYLSALVNHSTPSLGDKYSPNTLTRYFASMPWLKELMGDDWYLIESPKILLNSFLICISETLELVINSKNSIKNIDLSQLNKTMNMSFSERHRQNLRCEKLLIEIIKQRDEVNFNLMLSDFVRQPNNDEIEELFNSLICNESFNIRDEKALQLRCFNQPDLYLPIIESKRFKPSSMEKVLFSWLCAAQTVTASSVSKLTKNNFILQKSPNGRLEFIQCVYSKSRSSSTKKHTKLLTKGDNEFRAISAYLEAYGNGNNYLCERKKRAVSFSKDNFGNVLSRVMRLWQIPVLRKKIIKKHKATSSEPIFLKVMETIYKSSDISFVAWASPRRKKGLGEYYGEYVKETNKYLPQSIFRLSHIKTTAVHASSDKYRDGDLLNYNSHKSETEKTAYLTDDNKDWVNQHGRITRIVMNIVQETYSEIDFNNVITATRSKINNSKVSKPKNQATTVVLLDELMNSVIVLDTPETVINLLHYIEQSKKNFKKLLEVNLEFVEKILLPNVEWMNFILQQKLSPSIVKKGKEDYQSIKLILPNLFDAQLNFTA